MTHRKGPGILFEASALIERREKARIPAWCDRVLRKGDNLRQINYNTAALKFSDHRPVYATFLCVVTVIDEKRKDQLSKELYQQRKGIVGDSTAAGQADDSDEEDLLGFDSIEPTLPPASSDRRKWWLDNGQPAKSTLRSPGDNFVMNPNRPSNPWAPSQEPDWVKVMAQRSNGSSSSSPQRQSIDAQSMTSVRRKLPPPLVPTRDSSPTSSAKSMPTNQVPALPPRRAATGGFEGGIENRELISGLNRSSSSASTGSSNSIKRKPAPPIPKKPSVLAGSTSPKSEKKLHLQAQREPPPLLPPLRRAGTMGKHADDGMEKELSGPPSLPPRRGTGFSTGTPSELMDAGEDEMKGLKNWEALRPA